jgi:exopolyphosphatase / guanosine-5'-triphosphate,3'-diphosphate pyrophosphatase
MEKRRKAVIDIGTNSIKVLVADVEHSGIEPVWEKSKQTRLGRGLYKTHLLEETAILDSARAVCNFVAEARAYGAESVRVIATSAAREAANAQDLTRAVEEHAGLKVEILSGEQEADLVFQGVTTDKRLAQERLLLLDVGGGSTEFIVGEVSHQSLSASFELGSVRLAETMAHSDPPKGAELTACQEWVAEFLRTNVAPRLSPALIQDRPKFWLIGTVGTATMLARMETELDHYDRALIESTIISRDQLGCRVKQLWSLPLKERQTIRGLPANRADIILMGAVIFQAVMELFDFSELRISTRGLRFAAVR